VQYCTNTVINILNSANDGVQVALVRGEEQLAAAKPNYQTKPAQTDRLAHSDLLLLLLLKTVAE
jgi:hypothetical protein